MGPSQRPKENGVPSVAPARKQPARRPRHDAVNCWETLREQDARTERLQRAVLKFLTKTAARTIRVVITNKDGTTSEFIVAR